MPSSLQVLRIGALVLLGAHHVASTPLACTNVPAILNHTYTTSSVTFRVTNVTHYADHIPLDIENTSFNLTTTIGLPAFCRVELNITTSPTTSAHTEVWLPDSAQWNGRLLGTGTGGVAGGIQLGDLGNNGVQIGFAAFGTDGGHIGTITDASWGMYDADPNLLIDFSHRALHLSTVAAKIVTKAYYGHAPKSYYLGGSTGARQGLKAIQTYPEDYDGVLIVAPPYWQTRLQVWALHTAAQVYPPDGPTWLTPAQWGFVHDEIMKQCDALDGVVDGLIGDPRRCSFDPEVMACGSGRDNTTCLTAAQVGAVKGVYTPWTAENGTVLFDAYQPGGEANYAKNGFLGKTSPGFKLALSYMQYMVWNNVSTITPLNSTMTDVDMADRLDPGKLNVLDPDMRKFVSRKGKLMHFAGWADHLIAPLNSIHHHSAVETFMKTHTSKKIDDYYRLFMVAGMAHCRGGDGANYIGNNGLPYAAPYNDSTHNGLMALVEWVENGHAPDRLTATKFNNDWPPLGVNFTRPVCKYPMDVVWDKKGSIWQADSFACV